MAIKPGGAGTSGPSGPGTVFTQSPIGGNGSAGSPVNFTPLVDPVFYVDPVAGNDGNDGSIGAPFLTVNRGLRRLSPGWYGAATLNLRSGTHTIGARTVVPRPLGGSSTSEGGLLLNGSDNTDILGARTSAGGTTGSQQTFGTVIDSVGGLTVNAHRGQFLRFTSGGTLNGRSFVITDNTATTFTVAGTITVAPTTETFVVENPAAIITWAGTQCLQGHGSILGLQNLDWNGPGGANFLELFDVTIGMQRVKWRNFGSSGIVGREKVVVNALQTMVRVFGALAITQSCQLVCEVSGTITIPYGGKFRVFKGLIQNTRVELIQSNYLEYLDVKLLGTASIRCANKSFMSIDRARFDTVTPVPASSSFQGAAGAAIVVSKGSAASLLHLDISSTPATTAPGDGVLIEDTSMATLSDATGTGNAGLGCRVERSSQVRNAATNTLTGASGEVKIGNNLTTTWALLGTNTDLVTLCLGTTP